MQEIYHLYLFNNQSTKTVTDKNDWAAFFLHI